MQMRHLNNSFVIAVYKEVYPILRYDYAMRPYVKVLSANMRYPERNEMISESKLIMYDPFMFIIEGENDEGWQNFLNHNNPTLLLSILSRS